VRARENQGGTMSGIMGVSSFRENKIAILFFQGSFFCLALPLPAKSAGFSMMMMRGLASPRVLLAARQKV